MTPATLLTLLSCCLLLTSCTSVDRLLEAGAYEAAYDLALRRAELAHRPHPKRTAPLLVAYELLQHERLAAAADIAAGPDPARWPEVSYRYAAALERADRVAAIVGPESLGQLTVPPPDTLAARLHHSNVRSAAYLRRQADPLLLRARTGDREAARSAHHLLRRSLNYNPDQRRRLAPLLGETRDLGTVRIEVLPPAPTPLNQDFLYPHAARPPVEAEWLSLHHNPTDLRVDVCAEVAVLDYRTDGPWQRSSSRCYSEEVLDYVERKKVKEKINDSTYVEKTIEIEHFKTVTATATEYTQGMRVELLGTVTSFTTADPDLLTEDGLRTTADWTHTYTVCSGDRRAFPSGCGGMAASPPSEWRLLDRAARRLYPQAERRLICRYGVCPPTRPTLRWPWARR